MNIRKIGVWIKETNEIKQMPDYITKQWRILNGYKSRGYVKRVGRIGRSRTIMDNPYITEHVKRNRVYNLVYSNNRIKGIQYKFKRLLNK